MLVRYHYTEVYIALVVFIWLLLLHWLKIPERINFKVLSLTYNSLQFYQPTYTHVPSTTLHHPANVFFWFIFLSPLFDLAPGSLLISCSPTEPYPSLHHVFGMTYHQ